MPKDIESDESVMRRLKAGQPSGQKALDELVRRWSGPLKCFIQRMCGPASPADDIHQEVWTRVFTYRKSFDPARNFRSYLFSIAANACRTDHRQQAGVRKINFLIGVLLQETTDAGQSFGESEVNLDNLEVQGLQREVRRLAVVSQAVANFGDHRLAGDKMGMGFELSDGPFPMGVGR